MPKEQGAQQAAAPPDPDAVPCSICGLLYSVERQLIAVWRRDPITGRRVHEECVSGVTITRGPLVPRAGVLERTVPKPSPSDDLTIE